MTPREKKDVVLLLIKEGIEINSLTQEDSSQFIEIDQDDFGIVDEIHHKYNKWKIAIRGFLEKNNLNTIEWSIFYESDAVPLLPPLFTTQEYSQNKMPITKELLKNIRNETSKKLSVLKGLSKKLKVNLGKSCKSNDVIELGKKKDFKFNIRSGDIEYYKTKTNIKPDLQEYIILYELVKYSPALVDYLSLFNKLDKVKHKDYRNIIYTAIKKIKRRLKILPKGKKSNPDIFFCVEGKGYQLKVK